MATDNKIGGAKTAAHTLLNTLFGGSASTIPQSEYIRVALVPFAGAVRLNKNAFDYSASWIDTTGVNPLSKLSYNATTGWNNYTTWGKLKSSSSTFMSWNGCVEARNRGTAAAGTDYNVNDAVPTLGTPATLFPAYFNPDTAGSSYGYNYIGTTGTPNEYTGLTTTQRNDTSTAGLLYKQENQNKYLNRVISTEASGADGPWSNCAATPVVPMTYNRANVEAGIDAMTADGPTLIAEGLAWGWRALSPSEPFTKVEGTGTIPADTISTYGHPRWQKIMVLMTDGDNELSAGSYAVNGTTYSAYGRGKESPLTNNRFGTTTDSAIMGTLDNAMLAVCSKIKAEGIRLYVTSFGNGVSSSTRTRLQTCATDPTHYQHNTSSAELAAFFNHIGEDVLNKSIYVSK